jgi:sugar-specific transcriptional regulator TrmB
MTETILTKIGLKEKEAKIYLFCLKSGKSLVSDIAKHCELNRTSTYAIIDNLVDSGILHYSINNNVKYFAAADPEFLIERNARNLEKAQKNHELIEKTLPELNKIKNAAKSIKIDYYEGLQGIKQIYNSLFRKLKAKETLLELTSDYEYFTKHPNRELRMYLDDLVQRRVNKAVSLRLITTKSQAALAQCKLDNVLMRQTRIIAYNEQLANTDQLIIHQDKSYYFTLSTNRLSAFSVASASIAKLNRLMFETLWQQN